MTRPRVVYLLRSSSWDFRPGEPPVARVLVEVLHDTVLPFLMLEGQGRKGRGASKGYPLESMTGGQRPDELMLVDSEACLRAAVDTLESPPVISRRLIRLLTEPDAAEARIFACIRAYLAEADVSCLNAGPGQA